MLTSLIYFFSVFTMIMQQEELTGWHLSGEPEFGLSG